MRITGGLARGHKLLIPRVSDLRPSQDIARQAIFNWLTGKFELKGAKVLDLFAGTGGFGLEALSRGAAHCIFVDHKKDACETIEKNLKHSHFLGKAKVFCQDAKLFVSYQPPQSFDLIFLDPPYVLKLPAIFFEKFSELLTKNGILIYSHPQNAILPANVKNLPVVDTRIYGGCAISFLTKTTPRR